jgi:hypothetical protein
MTSEPVRIMYVNEDTNEAIAVQFKHREASEATYLSETITVDRNDWPQLNAWEYHADQPANYGDLQWLHQWSTAEIWCGTQSDYEASKVTA